MSLPEGKVRKKVGGQKKSCKAVGSPSSAPPGRRGRCCICRSHREGRCTAWCQLCPQTPGLSFLSRWMLWGSRRWNVWSMRPKVTHNKLVETKVFPEGCFFKKSHQKISESRSLKHRQRCHWHIYKITGHPDRLIWSSWVRTELTTRMASEGSVPAWQAFLAAVRLST